VAESTPRDLHPDSRPGGELPSASEAPPFDRRRQTVAALPDLLESLRPDLRAIRCRYRIPDEESDDLLQDTALALIARRDPVREPRRWLLATFRNRCRMYWRSRRRSFLRAIDTGLLEELAGGEAPEQERRSLRLSLTRALSTLPERCRSILGLRYAANCTHREIASRLGIPKQATVRQAALRCLSALSSVFLQVDRIPGS